MEVLSNVIKAPKAVKVVIIVLSPVALNKVLDLQEVQENKDHCLSCKLKKFLFYGDFLFQYLVDYSC